MSGAKKPVYLVMVTSNNNNKYYRMIPQGTSFTVEYGRIGSGCQKRTYSMSEWDAKYREKIRRGYKDKTDLIQDLIEEEELEDTKYKDIADVSVADIVRLLNEYSNDAIQANYKIGAQQVTQAMVDEAQRLIDILADYSPRTSVRTFNNRLINVFEAIPRKMKNVNDNLAKTKEDFPEIVKGEQDLLDTMRTQVYQKEIKPPKQETSDEPNQTILEALGLDIRPATDEEVREIKKQLGDCNGKFERAWRVVNNKTQARFDTFVKDNDIKKTKLLWHGSRNENWWSILNSGLVLRPSNAVITGKMFGYGTYYAPSARKSLGYTSLSGSYWANGHSKTGYMALMEVAYGKPFNVYTYGDYGNFNYDRLQKACPGANSLHAHSGKMLRNDEIVVYKEEQSTIKYLVELA